MQLENGYKQTDLGELPNDWQVTAIGDLNPFVTSGSRGWAAYYSDKGAPFVRITNLSRSSIYLDLDRMRYVELPNSTSEGERTQLQDGDVLISVTADIGIIGYVDASLAKPAYINQHIALVRLSDEINDSRFVGYFLAGERTQKLFRDSTDVGAKAGMSLINIREILLALPPFAEQRAIAEALGDVDSLIASLDALITKKRQIKQGTMQQLLTGKKRLPGFSGEWEETTLESVGTFRKGRNIPKKHLTPTGLPCVLYGQIYTHFDSVVSELETFIPTDIASQSETVRPGDILFAGSGETAEEIGKCFAYIGNDEAYAGGDLIILTPTEDNSEYLGYLLNSPPVMSQKAKLGQGSSVVHIYTSSLKTVVVRLPDTTEQTAIAEVLSDMDAEITALEQKRDKTKLIKQGMMQQLLTGKTRLKGIA